MFNTYIVSGPRSSQQSVLRSNRTMAPVEILRPPDMAVGTTVLQISKHQNSKKMMMFGLRTLSELCSPKNVKFKENSLSALMNGIVPILKKSVSVHNDDEDVILSSIKILYGISMHFLDFQEKHQISKFTEEEGLEAVSTVISNPLCTNVEEILQTTLSCLINLQDVGLELNPMLIAGGLTNCLSRASIATAEKILKYLLVLAKNEEVLGVIASNQGASLILDFISKLSPSEENSVVAEKGLSLFHMVIKQLREKTSYVETVIKIMDRFKGKKNVQMKGSAILAAFLCPNELKQCLDVLKVADVGSTERENALILLNSMSYISQYAEAIAKENAIPLVVDAVKTSSASLKSGSRESSLISGFNGGCKMLGSIARNPAYIDEVYKAEGLEVLIEALTCVSDIPESFCITCSSLEALMLQENIAVNFANGNSPQMILEYIDKYEPSNNFSAVVSLLNALLEHESTVEPIYNRGAFPVLCKFVKRSGSNSKLQQSTFSCLNNLAVKVEKIGDTFELWKSLCEVLSSKKHNEQLCVTVLKCLLKLCWADGAASTFQSEGVVDSVLTTLLNFKTSEACQEVGKDILEIIATEQDVKKCLEKLDQSMKDAYKKPCSAFECLAAVNGLARVSRLRNIFAKRNAAMTLKNGIKAWILGPPFPDQWDLINIAAQSVISLTMESKETLNEILIGLLECCTYTQLWNALQKQDPNSNSMLNLLQCCHHICSRDKLYEGSIKEIVELIAQLMWKYQDYRKVLLECFEMISEIVTVSDQDFLGSLSENAILKNIIMNMVKVIIYEDVQVAGLKFLIACVKKNSNAGEMIKLAGGVEACQRISASYSQSPVVKPLLSQLMNALMPSKFLDEDVKEIISSFHNAMKECDAEKAVTLLDELNKIGSSEEGCRSLLNNKIALALKTVSNLSAADAELLSQVGVGMSQLIRSICASRRGVSQMERINGLTILEHCLGLMMNKSVVESKKIRDGIIDNLYATYIINKKSKNFATKPDPGKLISNVAMLMTRFSDDKDLLKAAMKALASVPKTVLSESQLFSDILRGITEQLKSSDEKIVTNALYLVGILLDEMGDDFLEYGNLCEIVSDIFKAQARYEKSQEVRNETVCTLCKIYSSERLKKSVKNNDLNKKDCSRLLMSLKSVLMDTATDSPIKPKAFQVIINVAPYCDPEIVDQLKIVDVATKIVLKNLEDKQLMKDFGEFLNCTGSSDVADDLILQIIKLGNERSTNWQKNIEFISNKLSVLLSANINDSVYQNSVELFKVLGSVLEDEGNNQQLLVAISSLLKQFAKNFENDPANIHGVLGMRSSVIPNVFKLLEGDFKARENRILLGNCFSIMAIAVRNPDFGDQLFCEISNRGLLKHAYNTLTLFPDDNELLSSVLHLFHSISEHESGMQLLISQCPSKRAGLGVEDDMVAQILNIVKNSHGDLLILSRAIDIFGKMILANPNLLHTKDWEKLTSMAESSTEPYISYLRILNKFCTNNISVNHATMGPRIEFATNRLYDNETNVVLKEDLVLAYAEYIRAQVKNEDLDGFKDVEATNTLIEMVGDFKNNSRVLLGLLNVLTDIADGDAEINALIARNVPPILMNDCTEHILNDPSLCQALLSFFYSLGCNEGNGKLLSSMAGFNSVIKAFEIASAKFSPDEMSRIETTLKTFRANVEQDNPIILTLKEIYNRWNEKKTNQNSPLQLGESISMMQQFDWICDYMDEYSSTEIQNGLQSELGSEFQHGFLCFSLLHEHESNTSYCVEKDESRLIVQSFKNQNDQELVQLVVEAAKNLCKFEEGAIHLTSNPSAKECIINLIKTVSYENLTPTEADELIIPRLELLLASVISRSYYNNSDCMQELIEVWDLCDAKKYSVMTLRMVLRCMRKIMNETWMNIILSRGIPSRLIKIIEAKKDMMFLLMPDVFFLLGSIAFSDKGQVKTLLGDLKVIEICIAYMERCFKYRDYSEDQGFMSSPSLINLCLALSNITMNHTDNCIKFVNNKGIESNIKAMKICINDPDHIDYDVANAAAVLMCNMCYKRDNVKKLYGEKGGTTVLMELIKSYGGEENKAGFRCLNSLIRAIGNLAIYTPNVDLFLKENIELTFAHLFESSANLPDNILETAGRTLSNLVLEFTDYFMEKFQAVLLPILKMLKDFPTKSVNLLCLCYEILTNLTRLPENSKIFIENSGIEIVLKMVNSRSDPKPASYALRLLGIQVTQKEAVRRMQAASVYSFLANLFEDQATAETPQSDVCVKGLQCVKRLVRDKESSDLFIQAGGVKAVMKLICNLTGNKMIQLEGYRVIFTLLSLYPPPTPEKQQSEKNQEWDAEVEDEGLCGKIYSIERPPGPRMWECLKIEPEMVKSLILSVCNCLADPDSLKLNKTQKLGLGVLAYFACEKIPGTVESFYEGQINLVLRKAVLNLGWNVDVLLMVCYIVANISFVSQDEDFKILSRDLELTEALESACRKIPRKSPFKIFCNTVCKLLADTTTKSSQKFEDLCQWDFPLETSGWNDIQYPNGVHDLSAETKKFIRGGSKMKIIIDAETIKPFIWKSSQDLGMLQWKFAEDENEPFTLQVPVYKIRTISKGQISQSLLKKGLKADEKLNICISCPPTSYYPEGLDLNLKAKSRKERDNVAGFLSQWRDAASSGC